MNFKDNDIIFLLGAGASADANIPVSSKMVEDIEKEINQGEWGKYKDLYFLIKTSVQYSKGLSGQTANFNIEILLFVLEELIQKEKHLLYPFIGSWNVRFNEVVRDNFDLIREFQIKIRQRLNKWVTLKDYRSADYFKNIKKIKDELNFPLRIFTLNYDLCIEKTAEKNSFTIERGFEEESREWNYKRFDDVEADLMSDIYLYKLHGSIDWERDEETKVVSYNESNFQKPDLIFGTQNKLQFADPYLYLFSAFRHHTLKSKLIICIGYSFSDEHINGLITQALKQNKESKVLVIKYDNDKKEDIKNILEINEQQIEIVKSSAKEFFEQKLSRDMLVEIFPESNNEKFVF